MRTMKFDDPPLLGSVIEIGWENLYMTVLEVEPDLEGTWTAHYDYGAPEAWPKQWVATMRPATEDELEKARRGWEAFPDPEPRLSWFQRLFS